MELGKAALAARYAQEAKTAAESAQAAAVHPPVIGGNGNWQIWDQGSGAYVDSGLRAAGPAGEQGPQGEAGNYTKPAAGIPEEDLSQAVRNKLNSGGASDYADLNNKPGINGVTLSGNKTAAQLGLAAADDVPTKTSQLQNDVGFLTQHQSLAAYRTAAAQDAIDANLMALGLTGASVGDLVRVNAVDANGRPTSWKHVPLCEIKTNPNLLDNWYFIGGGSQLGDGVFPINQRGQTTYSGAGYGIDRWKSQNFINCTLTSDYITIGMNYNYTNFYQEISNDLSGKIITASCLTSNGLFSTTFVASTEAAVINIFTSTGGVAIYLRVLVINGRTRFGFFAGTGASEELVSFNVIAVKLELGSEQTLAHNEGTEESPVWVLNEIPDYGEELAKCQRYCIKLNRLNTIWQWVGNAIGWSTTEIDCFIPTPVTMIRNPSALDISEWMITDGLSYITPSNLALYASSGGIKAVATVTGATQGKAYFVGSSNSGESLLVSADL